MGENLIKQSNSNSRNTMNAARQSRPIQKQQLKLQLLILLLLFTMPSTNNVLQRRY